jgi:hypothetical protein
VILQFRVPGSRFVFVVPVPVPGSEFEVRRSFEKRGPRNLERRTPNPEPRTVNPEPEPEQ